MSLETWKAKTGDTLSKLLVSDEITQDNAILMAACIAIQAYEAVTTNPKITMLMDSAELEQSANIVDHVSGTDIDELMQTRLLHFVDYMQHKSDYQIKGTSTERELMLKAMDKMLHVEEQIVERLYAATSSKDERQKLRQTYTAILNKL